jgi:hypothetical protein
VPRASNAQIKEQERLARQKLIAAEAKDAEALMRVKSAKRKERLTDVIKLAEAKAAADAEATALRVKDLAQAHTLLEQEQALARARREALLKDKRLEQEQATVNKLAMEKRVAEPQVVVAQRDVAAKEHEAAARGAAAPRERDEANKQCSTISGYYDPNSSWFWF